VEGLQWDFGNGCSLVGQKRRPYPIHHAEIPRGWQPSENGNPVLIYKNHRITVFPADRGWKFCVAKIESDDDPFFSEAYHTEDAAKFEALARMDNRPSQHSTNAQDRAAVRKGKWEEQIAERVKTHQELSSALVAATTVTDLRKIERKVESQVKQSSWQIPEYYRDGVSRNLIEQAEEMEKQFQSLATSVALRITELKSQRTRKDPAAG